MQDYKNLVEQNTNLVHYVIQKQLNIPQTDPEYLDLAQEGMLALTVAARRFDADKGHHFATFAVPYISGYVRRYRRERVNSGIRLPRAMYDQYAKFLQKVAQGYTAEEAAKELELSSADFFGILNSWSAVRLDQSVHDKHGDTIEGSIADIVGTYDKGYLDAEKINGLDPDLDECLARSLRTMGDGLNKEIWRTYINLCRNGEKVTQKELAARLNVSQASASRALRKGRAALRMIMDRKGLDIGDFA